MKITKEQLQKFVTEAVEKQLVSEGAKMTRQHFQFIADVLRQYNADRNLCELFAKNLARTNPGFKEEAFMKACGW